MRKQDIYPTIIFRILVLIFASFLFLSSYPTFNIEQYLLFPFFIFGFGLDLITIKNIFEKNVSPIETPNEIIFQPYIGFRASVSGLIQLTLFLFGILYFHKNHQNKYLLIAMYSVTTAIPFYLWSMYRDFQRKIIIVKDSRVVRVLRKNIFNKQKIKEISLNEFSTITSTIVTHRTGEHSY
jgi:hypothetical protein